MRRRRPDSSEMLSDELAAFADNKRAQASRLAPGKKRNDLLRWARRADTSSQLIVWAKSPDLLPPEADQTKDLTEHLEKLLSDAADCADVSALARNKEKREFFAKLSVQLTKLADQVERVVNATKH